MNRKIIPVGSIAANCIVLWDDPSAAWIVDPGAESDKIAAFLEGAGLTPALIVLTHGHFDHVGAIPGLLARWPQLPVHIGPGDEPFLGDPRNAWPPDYELAPKPSTLTCDLVDGATLSAGGLEARIISTPGHTPGGSCLYFQKDALLLTGDTLFAGSCGRTDFPGGSMAQLQASLARLAALPPETDVICGHGMPTTIANERAENPYLPRA